LEFFLAAVPKQKGNSKLIFRTGYRGSGPTRVASNPRDKAAELRLVVLAAVYRPLRPMQGPLRLSVTFVLPIPPSWPARKRAEALAGVLQPIGRPDRGNMLKLVEDALQAAGFYADDSQIVGGEVAKRYGDPPGYRIQITPVGQEAAA
jgi:Holliday junction resolvase RusA-like endonuclease